MCGEPRGGAAEDPDPDQDRDSGNDHDHDPQGWPDPAGPDGVTRREALTSFGLAALAVAGPATDAFHPPAATGSSTWAAPATGGRMLRTGPTAGVVRAAMHVHSSFSEGSGGFISYASQSSLASMESHADSLTGLGFDLCFYTDHDHRIAAENYGMSPQAYPGREDFTARTWTYTAEAIGGPRRKSMAFTPAGLVLSVTAASRTGSSLACAAGKAKEWNYRTTLAGMRLDVLLIPPTGRGWAELRIRTSHRPAIAGRAAGNYDLLYRFSRTAPRRTATVSGRAVTVTVPVAGGAQTQSVVPTDDLAAAFPDLGMRALDNGLYVLWFGVGAPAGVSATATFRSLNLTRSCVGEDALALQRDLVAELQPRYPELRLVPALELSYGAHLNWIPSGTAPSLIRPTPGVTGAAYARAAFAHVRAAGGLVTYNHPFGAVRGPLLTGPARSERIDTVAKAALAHDLYGATMLEVGYAVRGNVDLDAHLHLWDALLAAGSRVLADGASDNHTGTFTSWAQDPNRFVTDVIADCSDPAVVVPAMQEGRCFVSALGGYAGMLDLRVGETPMGGTAELSGTTVALTAFADGVPSDGTLGLVQYAVHRDRSAYQIRSPIWESTTPASGLVGGSTGAEVPVQDSYIRAEVRDGAGAVVAFSNPVFLTRAPAPV